VKCVDAWAQGRNQKKMRTGRNQKEICISFDELKNCLRISESNFSKLLLDRVVLVDECSVLEFIDAVP
jgi:hypothetical protein